MRKRMKTKGFTLVELLIAIVLSSIVVAAAFALFVNSNRVYTSSGMDSQVQQTTRAALDIISNELVMAGFGALGPNEIADMQVVEERENEMAITASLENRTDGPDRLQYKASLGGAVVLVEDVPVATIVGGAGGGIAVHPTEGHDLLTDGMAVQVFNLDRERLGSGVLGAISGLAADRILFSSFVVDPNMGGLAVVPLGSVVMQTPSYITYYVDGNMLVRATSATRGTDAYTSNYVLARGVVDMQFSYYLGADPQDATLPTGWQPAIGTSVDMTSIDNRRRIRGIRIDLLVRSEEPNPMLSGEDCTNDMVKKVYMLGDRVVDVGASACVYTFVQMSTIVHTPNLFVFASDDSES